MMHLGEEPTVYKAMNVRTLFPNVLVANSPLRTVTQTLASMDKHVQGLVRHS